MFSSLPVLTYCSYLLVVVVVGIVVVVVGTGVKVKGQILNLYHHQYKAVMYDSKVVKYYHHQSIRFL